ncbi:DUF1700 domain-containing protein, partial [Lactobacillus sp. XV13L]|nr:DUF1700 domain-containing protein [Lactobacillus sp. XV13L]
MTTIIDDYIFELEKHLSDLPAADRKDVSEFYREFLLDGDFASRTKIEQELGTPKQLAHKILADYSTTDEPQRNTSRNASKSNLKSIWYILLGICAAPIGIPLVIAALAVIIALLATCFGLFVGFMGLVFGLFVGGGLTLIKSVTFLFTANWAIGCFYIGAALIALSAALFLAPFIARLVRWLIAECTL